MPMAHIPKDASGGAYYLTFVAQRWHYIFDRHGRWQILADALAWMQRHRGLQVHAFVFMLNHLHLMASSPDAAGFVRDYKKWTSARIRDNIATHEPSVMKLFMDARGDFHLWKKSNAPRLIESEKFFRQKTAYIENNPVVKGYVARPEHWLWSSANPDSPVKIVRP